MWSLNTRNNYGVTQIIELMGLGAGTARIKTKRTKADISVSEKLRIDVGSSLVVIQRIRTGNGKPVVYIIDIMPEATLGRIDLPRKFKGSLYKFLEEKYDQNRLWYSQNNTRFGWSRGLQETKNRG